MKKFILSLAIVMSMAMPFRALDLVSIDHSAKDAKKAAVLNNSYFDLSTGSFSQDWTNAGLITVNDNWSGVPSIQGFLGQDMTTATGVDPQTLLAGASLVPNDLDVLANQSAPNTVSNGGVIEFDGIPNPSIALNGSGTADAPHVVLYMNTVGRQSVNVSYNARDLDGGTDNAIMPVALQYRVGETGDFTNVPAAFIADATTGPSIATLVTPVNVTLPAAIDNQAQVQLRIMTTNAVGNDEAIGIDDIVVSSTAAGGNPGSIQLTSSTSSVTEGTASINVTASRTVGTTGAVGVSFATSNGTATSGTCGAGGSADYQVASGTLSWADGDAADKTFSVTLCDDTDFEGDESFSVAISNPTGGATLGSPTSNTITIQDDDAEPAVIAFEHPVFGADESQIASIFVTRSGNTTETSTVTVTHSQQTATPGSGRCTFGADYLPSATQTLTFAPSETSKTVLVDICGDQFPDSAESFGLNLSSPTGAVLGSTVNTTVSINDTASQYRNDDTIEIEDNAQTSSSINVSGQAGPVGTIRVSLYDVIHINPADMDVLLVAPDGRQIILMADAGGVVNSGVPAGFSGPPTLTFTDTAAQVLPQLGPLLTGQYEPTSWTSGQPNFNSPAPAGPYNEPGSAVGGGPNLTSVFNGGAANGTWTLYVRDDNGAAVSLGGTNGTIGGGWGIDFISQPDSAASMSGKVVDESGYPIRSAILQLNGPGLAQPKTVVTNTFGRFLFTGLQAGHQYTLQAASRRYVISPTTATFTLNSSYTDVILVGLQ